MGSTPTRRSPAIRRRRRTVAARTARPARITHTTSCWVFQNNNVHDNNNADVPAAGSAAQGPVGTGMTISGGRWNTVMNNTFTNNGAWGVLFLPYPDSGTPYGGKTCADYGGVQDTSAIRMRPRSRGQRAHRQHLLRQRLLRQRDERRLRGADAQQGRALELLREQHGARRELPDRSGDDPSEVRTRRPRPSSRERC